jgi:hypothetical protein
MLGRVKRRRVIEEFKVRNVREPTAKERIGLMMSLPIRRVFGYEGLVRKIFTAERQGNKRHTDESADKEFAFLIWR